MASSTPASDGGLSTSQLAVICIAAFAFFMGAVLATIMIYRRKRRRHVDVEAPKEYPALRATENMEVDTDPKGKTALGAISSKLRAWSKPRSLRSGTHLEVGSTSGDSCPSRGQVSAHQDQSALSIVQSKFGQLRTSDQDIQTAEAVRLEAYPGFVGNSIMLDPAGYEPPQSPQPQQSPRVDPIPETAIAEITIPPEAHAQNMRQDRLSLYFGHPFPSYAAPASLNRGSPNLPSDAALDDDTSTSIDTTLSDDEREEPPQRVPTPVKIGFPPEASSAERVGSVALLTQRASTASAPSPSLGAYLQAQPRLPSPAPEAAEDTVAKRPTMPNWDYHFF
jgi:hypothetical protein